MKINFYLKMKVKLKAEPLYNRILLLINRVKGYLNEVGRKQHKRDFPFFIWVKGYLNEVGRKHPYLSTSGLKGI